MIARALWGLLGFLVPPSRLWACLGAHPIVVFVGPNGAGKTLAAVWWVLPTLAGIEWTCRNIRHEHHAAYRAHAEDCPTCEVSNSKHRKACVVGTHLIDQHARGQRRVLATCRLTTPEGHDHPLWVPFTDYRQLLTFEHGEILMDEVAGVADASGSSSMPVQVINHLHKLRHFDCTLGVTTPAYERCALPIRQAAQLVVDCRSFFVQRRRKGDDVRRWRSRRAFLFAAFDAFSFEQFTAHRRETIKPMARAALWRPGSLTERSYDTLDQVLALGHVTDTGMCMVCGGHRTRPRCSCSTDDTRRAMPVALVPRGTDGEDGASAPQECEHVAPATPIASALALHGRNGRRGRHRV